jgi:hypothetical protein
MDKRRKAKGVTTGAEQDGALGPTKPHDNDLLARTVQYVPLLKIIIIGLNNGRRIALSIEDVPALSRATKKVLQNCELLGGGTAINFPDINVRCRSMESSRGNMERAAGWPSLARRMAVPRRRRSGGPRRGTGRRRVEARRKWWPALNCYDRARTRETWTGDQLPQRGPGCRAH